MSYYKNQLNRALEIGNKNMKRTPTLNQSEQALLDKQVIRDYIKEKGINQSQMAELLGIKRATLSRYMSTTAKIKLNPPRWIMINIELRKELEGLKGE